MALEGELEVIGLADIFQTLSASQRAGTLLVENADSRRSIYFREGQVWVKSEGARKNLKLGEALIAQGKITPKQLRDALEEQKITKERLGQILEASGLASEQDIEAIVRGQLEEDIYDLFTWKTGKFKFLEDSTPEGFEDTADILHLNVAGIVMEAARRRDELDLIREWIPSDDWVFQIKEGVGTDAYQDTFRELVLNLLDGQSTVNDVEQRLGGQGFELKTALAELLSDDIIEPVGIGRLLDIGAQALANEDPSRAARIFAVAAEREPQELGHHVHLAEAYEASGDRRRAGAAYKAGASAAAEAGEVEYAVDFLTRARKLLPNDLDVNEQVLDLLHTFREVIPEAESRFLEEGKALVKAYRREKRYDEAVNLCRRLIREDPKDLEIHKALVNLFLDQEDKEEAIAEYEVVVQLLLERNDWDELVNVYSRMAKLDPDRAPDIEREIEKLTLSRTERKRRAVKRALAWAVAVLIVAILAGLIAAWVVAQRSVSVLAGRVDAAVTDNRTEEAQGALELWQQQHPYLAVLVSGRLGALANSVDSARQRQEAARIEVTQTLDRVFTRLLDSARQALSAHDLASAHDDLTAAIKLFDEQKVKSPPAASLHIDAYDKAEARLAEVKAFMADGTRRAEAIEHLKEEARELARQGDLDRAQTRLEAARKGIVEFLAQPAPEAFGGGEPDNPVLYRHFSYFQALEMPVLVATTFPDPVPATVERETAGEPLRVRQVETPFLASIPQSGGSDSLRITFHPPPGAVILPAGSDVILPGGRDLGIGPALLTASNAPMVFNLESPDGGDRVEVFVNGINLRPWGEDRTASAVVLAEYTSALLLFTQHRLATNVGPDGYPGVPTRQACTAPASFARGSIYVPAQNEIYRLDHVTGETLGTPLDITAGHGFSQLADIRAPMVPMGGSLWAVESHSGGLLELVVRDRDLAVSDVYFPPGTPDQVEAELPMGVAGETLIFCSLHHNTIYAFDTRLKGTPEQAWSSVAISKYGADLVGGLTVAGNLVYVLTSKSIWACSLENGRLAREAPRWVSNAVINQLRGSPVVDGNVIYALDLDGPYLYAIDLGTSPSSATWRRVQLGSKPAGSLRMNPSYRSPVVADGMVLAAGLDGALYGFRTYDPRGPQDSIVSVWRVPLSTQPIEATPVVNAGVVYVGTRDGDFFALSLATGQVLWRFWAYDVDPEDGQPYPDRITLPAALPASGEQIVLPTVNRVYMLGR